MEIKVGDKVKVTGIHSVNGNKIELVISINKVLTGGTVTSFFKNGVEIVNYTQEPKFKVGDVVYSIETKAKFLILEEREDDLRYHCWSYADDTDVFMLEKELTLEEPKEA